MAKTILTDAYIEVDSVEISDHVSEVTIETSKDEVDVTSMGAAFKEIALGMGDATITANVFQDFDASQLHATIQPLYDAGVPFDVVVRPKNAVAAADNPEFTMSSVLTTYNPLAGAVGAASTTTLTFRNASQTGITIATGA